MKITRKKCLTHLSPDDFNRKAISLFDDFVSAFTSSSSSSISLSIPSELPSTRADKDERENSNPIDNNRTLETFTTATNNVTNSNASTSIALPPPLPPKLISYSSPPLLPPKNPSLPTTTPLANSHMEALFHLNKAPVPNPNSSQSLDVPVSNSISTNTSAVISAQDDDPFGLFVGASAPCIALTDNNRNGSGNNKKKKNCNDSVHDNQLFDNRNTASIPAALQPPPQSDRSRLKAPDSSSSTTMNEFDFI